MKKIAIVFMLLLTGCYIDNSEDNVIDTIQAYKDGSRCAYGIKGSDIELHDICGAYQIGDKIKFVKKEE